MLVFVAGPSCSGKTRLARQWQGVACVHLDKHEGPVQRLAAEFKARDETAIFEGMLSGRRQDIEALLELMDALIVLDAPLPQRMGRVVRRDGPSSLPRFLRNEFYWHAHNRPILFQGKYDAIRRVTQWEYASPPKP